MIVNQTLHDGASSFKMLLNIQHVKLQFVNWQLAWRHVTQSVQQRCQGRVFWSMEMKIKAYYHLSIKKQYTYCNRYQYTGISHTNWHIFLFAILLNGCMGIFIHLFFPRFRQLNLQATYCTRTLAKQWRVCVCMCVCMLPVCVCVCLCKRERYWESSRVGADGVAEASPAAGACLSGGHIQ